MTEIQLTHFSFGGDSPERSRFYEVALREARIATEAHASDAPVSAEHRRLLAGLGLPARLRALAGGPAMQVDACACTA